MPKRTSHEAPANQMLLDEAPLFAGLEGYVIQKHEKPQPEKPKKVKTVPAAKAEVKKAVKSKPKAPAPAAAAPEKTAKKTAAARPAPLDPDAILLSIREMCHLLKISRATLVRMDNAGKIPGKMKLGGSIRFHRATIESWLEGMISHANTPF